MGKGKKSRIYRRAEARDMKKTIGTLQMWQQQMAALQRATQINEFPGDLDEFGHELEFEREDNGSPSHECSPSSSQT